MGSTVGSLDLVSPQSHHVTSRHYHINMDQALLLFLLLPAITTPFLTRHPYSYQYNVRDPRSRNDYQVTEVGGPDSVSGSYQVHLPDGRTQIVSYEVRAGEGYKAVVRYEGEAVYPESPAEHHSLGRQAKQLDSRPSKRRITDALFSEVYRDTARDSRVRKQRKLQDLELAPSQNVISGTEAFQTNFALNRNLPIKPKQENYFPPTRRKLKKSPLIKKVRVPVSPVLPKYVKKTKPEKVFEIPIQIVEDNVEITAEQITKSTKTTEQPTAKESEEENTSATESPLKPAGVETTTGKISEFETLKEIEEIGNTVTDEYDEDYFEDYYIFPFGSRLTSVILNPSSEEEKVPGPASAEPYREADQEGSESSSVKPRERIDPVHPGSPQPVRFVKTRNNTFVPEFYTS